MKPETRNLLSLVLRPLLSYWARRSLPQRRGIIELPGLNGTVEVRWDSYAVPHIFSANEHDLFLAQGYIHAQERLWQMDSTRIFLSGRLAEVYGEKPAPWRDLSIHLKGKTTADLDHFMRLIGIRDTAQASLQRLPEEFVCLLRAYTEGINRYIERHLKRLPIEFRLLRYAPEPWKPEDSLLIGKGFAFFLSTSLFTRLAMGPIAEKLKDQDAKLKSLFPRYPEGDPCITHFDSRPVAEASLEVLRFVNGTFQDGPLNPAGQGSNSWVIAPSRSTTGRPILCNDPHLRMVLPSTWYLIHLKSASDDKQQDGYETWGASIPGSPCVHLGHNRWIAWGITAAVCDDGDLYREKIHPANPDLYLAGDRWALMDGREEKIRIRGGNEIVRKLRFTRHGPIISDIAGSKPKSEALAFRWTAHDPAEELRSLYGVNCARNWKEFLQSLSHQVAPTLNYVYADTQGNIGYSLAGRVPIRSRPASLLPLEGWTGEHDWKGYIPFEELPRLYNPPQGVIATANNRIVDSSYSYYLSDLFEAPYRIRRIRELLASREKFSPEQMAQIQQDAVSLQAKELIAHLKNDLAHIALKEASLHEPIDRLFRWDGGCSQTSFEASLFHVFYHRLMINLLTPDLGPELFVAFAEIFNQSLVPVDQILQDPRSPWFTARSRADLVETSLREAVQELRSRFGADMEHWNWGKLHTLTLQHPFGRSKILAPIFSLGPFPSPGGGVTINMGFYRHSNPYKQTVGASLRIMLDVGGWEQAGFVLASGQSGHAFSPHYGDQTELWRQGRAISIAHPEDAAGSGPSLVLRTPRSVLS